MIGGLTAAAYWGLMEAEHHGPIDVLVAQECTRVARGVRTLRIPDPGARAHPARRPPVTTIEDTVCDAVAASSSDARAAEVVLRAARLRLTSPQRILATAAGRARLGRRALLRALCAEVLEGVTSPLEAAYRTRVARAHRLPGGLRQVAALSMGDRRVYRDIEYPEQGVIIELDGRLGHERESAVLRDQFRDNAATLTGRATLRFGWLGVIAESCQVAGQVSSLLQLRGWTGTPRPCGPGCALERS